MLGISVYSGCYSTNLFGHSETFSIFRMLYALNDLQDTDRFQWIPGKFWCRILILMYYLNKFPVITVSNYLLSGTSWGINPRSFEEAPSNESVASWLKALSARLSDATESVRVNQPRCQRWVLDTRDHKKGLNPFFLLIWLSHRWNRTSVHSDVVEEVVFIRIFKFLVGFSGRI